MSGGTGVSDGRSGCGCSGSSCSMRFRADGGDGAVAALDGSVAAPLVDLYYICILFEFLLFS